MTWRLVGVVVMPVGDVAVVGGVVTFAVDGIEGGDRIRVLTAVVGWRAASLGAVVRS